MLRSFLALAVLLSLVMSFIDFTGVYLETGGRITWPLLGTLAYQESFLTGGTAMGSAMTLVERPVWLAVLWIGFRLFELEPFSAPPREIDSGWRPLAPRPPSPVGPRLATIPPSRQPKARPHINTITSGAQALGIVVFAVFPIWWIFLQAMRPISEDSLGNPFWTWAPSLDGFSSALHGRLVGAWLLNTFIVLVLGIALTLTASALAGYALGRRRVPGARWIGRLLFASYFLPYPMLLVPVYQIFLWLNLDNSLLAVVLLNQTLTIPFGTWLCSSYFRVLP